MVVRNGTRRSVTDLMKYDLRCVTPKGMILVRDAIEWLESGPGEGVRIPLPAECKEIRGPRLKSLFHYHATLETVDYLEYRLCREEIKRRGPTRKTRRYDTFRSLPLTILPREF